MSVLARDRNHGCRIHDDYTYRGMRVMSLGHVLSPVDNITVDEPRTWRNIEICMDEWRKRW